MAQPHPSEAAIPTFEAVGPGIYVADAIATDVCASIIREFEGRDEWKPAKITRYEYDEASQGRLEVILDRDKRVAERVHYSDIDVDDFPSSKLFFQFVIDRILPFIGDEYGLSTEEFGEAEIVRYPPGGIFIPHSDSNKLKPYRAFSVILYLNDSFGGGETSFPTLNYRCVPRTGRVLLFPSQLLHGGERVVDGEKHIIVLWIFYPGGMADG